MFSLSRRPSATTTSTRHPKPLRNGQRKPAAPRARLEVTHLEDRVVPSTITGLSFVEQPGFFPVLGQTTVFSSPTLFQTQINQTWQNILSGKQLVGGITLQQEVVSSIQQAAQQQGVSAYNISESFASSGAYSAQLNTTGANPTLSIQFQLSGNTANFTTTTNSIFGSWADPTFEVSYGLTLTVNVTLPSSLSSRSTVSASASAVVGPVTVTSHNVGVAILNFFGNNIPAKIANQLNGHTQDLSGLVPTAVLNTLLDGEAAKGFTHLHAGLDGNGNLQLIGQEPNLVVQGNTSDHIVVSAAANGSVTITAAGQTATFDPGYLKSITINSNAGTNSIQILSVPAGVSVSVKDDLGGTDNVTVGNGSLAAVAGPVSVSNTSGKTTLTLDDSADTANRNATITSSSVQFAGLSPVSYSGKVTSLQVKGGQGTDSYYVNSTASGTPVNIVTSVGVDSVYVGNGSLAHIAAAVNVQSNSSRTSLYVNDSSESGRNATMTSNSVSFTGVPAITFGGNVTALDVIGASGHNTITVASVPSSVPVAVYNMAHNTVTGAAASSVTKYAGL